MKEEDAIEYDNDGEIEKRLSKLKGANLRLSSGKCSHTFTLFKPCAYLERNAHSRCHVEAWHIWFR